MQSLHQEAVELAINESKANVKNNYKSGGPFGAAIVKDGTIITSGHNTVVENTDPTAHAEINAIRKASKKLGTHDLSGCVLYTSAEPCPMCLSAIIWANIKKVYYLNSRKETAKIGFRDDIIYEYLSGNKKDVIELHHIENKDALEVFKNFQKTQDKNMY